MFSGDLLKSGILVIACLGGGVAMPLHAACSFNGGIGQAIFNYSPDLSSMATSSPTSYIVEQYTLLSGDLVAASGARDRFSPLVTCTDPSDKITIGGSSMAILPLSNNSINFMRPDPTIDLGMFVRGTGAGSWRYPSESGGAIEYTVGEYLNKVGKSFDATGGTLSWADLTYDGSNIAVYTYKGGQIITGGRVSGGMLSTINIGGLDVLSIQLSTFDVVKTGCTITHDATVELGTAYVQRFSGVGSATNKTDFNVAFLCDSSNLSPTLRFDGEIDSLFPLVFSNQGSAENIGVQLHYSDNPINPGVPVSLGKVNTTAERTYKFTAQLIKLADVMTPGTIDVPVTLTLDFE